MGKGGNAFRLPALLGTEGAGSDDGDKRHNSGNSNDGVKYFCRSCHIAENGADNINIGKCNQKPIERTQSCKERNEFAKDTAFRIHGLASRVIFIVSLFIGFFVDILTFFYF